MLTLLILTPLTQALLTLTLLTLTPLGDGATGGVRATPGGLLG